jgi:hypothetical protein
MTLINHPGSHQQAALACLDAGIARDIALMLADARAVLDWLASGDAPPSAARGAAAALAGAVAETEARLWHAIRDALAGIPGSIPGT